MCLWCSLEAVLKLIIELTFLWPDSCWILVGDTSCMYLGTNCRLPCSVINFSSLNSHFLAHNLPNVANRIPSHWLVELQAFFRMRLRVFHVFRSSPSKLNMCKTGHRGFPWKTYSTYLMHRALKMFAVTSSVMKTMWTHTLYWS